MYIYNLIYKSYNLKSGKIFFQTFKYVLRTIAILSWFVLDLLAGSLLFVLDISGQAETSGALSRLHMQLFYKKF